MTHDDIRDSRPRQADGSRVIYDWKQFEGPAKAIIEATARATNSQPTELSPLQQYADADSLAALLRGPESVEIAFDYDQVAVNIDSDGKLVVGAERHSGG